MKEKSTALLDIEKIEYRSCAAGLRVVCADIYLVNPCLHQSTRAHLAGLQGHIHFASLKSPVACNFAGFFRRPIRWEAAEEHNKYHLLTTKKINN